MVSKTISIIKKDDLYWIQLEYILKSSLVTEVFAGRYTDTHVKDIVTYRLNGVGGARYV